MGLAPGRLPVQVPMQALASLPMPGRAARLPVLALTLKSVLTQAQWLPVQSWTLKASPKQRRTC